MSLPLPPEYWHIDPDDVAVVIDGVTFIETKEEAARLVAEGRATYPSQTRLSADASILNLHFVLVYGLAGDVLHQQPNCRPAFRVDAGIG